MKDDLRELNRLLTMEDPLRTETYRAVTAILGRPDWTDQYRGSLADRVRCENRGARRLRWRCHQDFLPLVRAALPEAASVAFTDNHRFSAAGGHPYVTMLWPRDLERPTTEERT